MTREAPKTVFFDLDGTLVDNYDAITACVGDSIEPLGFPRPTRERIMRVVGGSIILTMEKLVGKALAEKAGRSYMERIGPMTFLGLREMPYASEILDRLNGAGIRCACLTNKSQKSADEILAHLGLDKKLCATIGTSLLGPHKPSREFTQAAAEKIGAEASTSLMVGDSPYDYQTAENFGMPCLLVATGGNPIEELRSLCPNAAGIYPDMESLCAGYFQL